MATFVVAARECRGHRAGARCSCRWRCFVLVAMGLPLNVAGWGPREGAAGWAFGVAGLGTTGGVGTAVVYGVIALVASPAGCGTAGGGLFVDPGPGPRTIDARGRSPRA